MLTVPTSVAVVQPWFDAGVFGPTEVHAAAVVSELLEPDPDTDLVVLAFAVIGSAVVFTWLTRLLG